MQYECIGDHGKDSSSSSADNDDDAYDLDVDSAACFLTSLAGSPQKDDQHSRIDAHLYQNHSAHKKKIDENIFIGLPSINISASQIDCLGFDKNNTRVSRKTKRPTLYSFPMVNPSSSHVLQSRAHTRNQQHSTLLISRLASLLHLKSRVFLKNDADVVNQIEDVSLGRKFRSRKQGISYAPLLNCVSSNDNGRVEKLNLSSQHWYPTERNALMVSMVPIRGNKRLREQLNKEYRKTVPWLHYTMTISKLSLMVVLGGRVMTLRTLKYKVPTLDPSTVAVAWVYFEDLVSFGVVHKGIRKQFAAACLLLAYKFNQDPSRDNLTDLINAVQTLDSKDNLKARDIFAMEFSVFAAIRFNLQAPFSSIQVHLDEYLSLNNKTFEAQYGIREALFLQPATSFADEAHLRASQPKS